MSMIMKHNKVSYVHLLFEMENTSDAASVIRAERRGDRESVRKGLARRPVPRCGRSWNRSGVGHTLEGANELG